MKKIAAYIDSWRERALQGVGIPGDSDTVGYILLGLAAVNHTSDEATDAMARFVKGQQYPNGRWRVFAHRPPIESSDIQVTAVSMRPLQLYGPKRTPHRVSGGDQTRSELVDQSAASND